VWDLKNIQIFVQKFVAAVFFTENSEFLPVFVVPTILSTNHLQNRVFLSHKPSHTGINNLQRILVWSTCSQLTQPSFPFAKETNTEHAFSTQLPFTNFVHLITPQPQYLKYSNYWYSLTQNSPCLPMMALGTSQLIIFATSAEIAAKQTSPAIFKYCDGMSAF